MSTSDTIAFPVAMSTYGTIAFPSPGPRARNTDALEALLALCRSLGLHYTIVHHLSDAIHVTLTQDGPLDAFAPYTTRRTYHVAGIPGCAAPDVLRIAMTLALRDLRANAELYRRQVHVSPITASSRDAMKGTP
jgi:hypothetical protein